MFCTYITSLEVLHWKLRASITLDSKIYIATVDSCVNMPSRLLI